jgi:hypothetical protein
LILKHLAAGMRCATVVPMMQIDELKQLATACRKLYDKTAKISPDLFGLGVLDLMADNLQGSLSDLRIAIILSGIYDIANARIKRQISYYPECEDWMNSND